MRATAARTLVVGVLTLTLTGPSTTAWGAGASSASGAVSVSLAPRTVTALPGYRNTGTGPVLDVARFTSLARLDVPASLTTRGAVVLSTRISVDVPIRLALSVRAWCAAPSAVTVAPGPRSFADVLVIGQNPVPGSGSTAVAARTVTGRAVVQVPRGTALRCLLQVSPRTESTASSRLRVRSGRLEATAASVLARAAQRPALLAATAGAPGVPRGRSAARLATVARLGPVATTAGVRLEGEAELTTCALGYHLCGRGGAPTSVVDVTLVLQDLAASGRVCATWRGSARQVTITPPVHHVKVIAPSLTPLRRCGVAVRGHLEVRPRGGNAVEIEPVLLDAGQPRRVQTHTWLQSAG